MTLNITHNSLKYIVIYISYKLRDSFNEGLSPLTILINSNIMILDGLNKLEQMILTNQAPVFLTGEL